jgi:hypothetical protein
MPFGLIPDSVFGFAGIPTQASESPTHRYREGKIRMLDGRCPFSPSIQSRDSIKATFRKRDLSVGMLHARRG